MSEKVIVPSVGESVTEVTVAKLIAKEGSYVKEGDPVIEIESDKASMEVPAGKSGVVHFSVKEEDTLKIGDEVATIDTTAEAPTEKAEEKKQEPPREKSAPSTTNTPAPPQPTSIPSAPSLGVRKTKEEFLSSLTQKEEAHLNDPVKEVSGGQIRKPMSKLRKTIAKRLVQVKNETAMLTTFNEVDMSKVMELRSKEKEAFQKKHGLKLTFLPFFVKAVVSALKEFPGVNAYIDKTDIVYNNHTNVGIAVSTDSGLVVPVIKEADNLSFIEITQAISDLAVKARDRKLSIDDMSHGTFTITNGGVFGSMLSTPILNPPQSGILGMHNIVERPIAVNGKVEIRPIMYLALSYDHRIVDGKESVSFLVHIKKLLEDPGQFLLTT